MKLLVVSHSCAVAVNRLLYAEVGRQTGWQISIVLPSNWKNEYGVVADVVADPDGSLELLPTSVFKPGNIILHAYRRSFGRLLKRLNPDAIYVHHEPYAVATAQVYLANWRQTRKPIGFYSAQNIAKRYPPPFCWTEAMVLRQSSFSFPVSTEVENVFRNKGYTGRSTVLPLGVDLSVYRRQADLDTLKNHLRSNGEVLVGHLGRIVPEKGLSTLLKSLSLIRDLPWRLVMVGSGGFKERFDAEAAELGLTGRIVHVGFVPHEQAPRYLSAFDVLVLPSETQPNWKEQFGRVVIEAMACGTPVVGSDSGEIPNLIRDTGGGLIFKERQPQELADRLATLIRDPSLRDALAQRGREAAEARYSLPAIAGKFAATIEAAVAGRTGTKELC